MTDDQDDQRQRREEELERLILQEEEAQDVRDEEDNDDEIGGNMRQENMGEQQAPDTSPAKFKISYTTASFGAAFGLVWYALRTRQQWYLALVFLASSKYSYIILGNAIVAFCVRIFYFFTNSFLGGLRLVEAEGLADFFRWNITEMCLALTMFRAELTVESGIFFLFLVLGKCLHWVVENRESHLRMTKDAISAVPTGFLKGFPQINRQHLGLMCLIQVLLVLDAFSVVHCIQNVAIEGPSVLLLFGFESAILLVTSMSLTLLWNLHVLDGFLHYCHDSQLPFGNILHAWKDRKATFIFAMEVQAQLAKFLFYCAFFCIVFTYYGLPINLFREVYVSFQQLKSRLVAFSKYRKLVRSMNRYPAPTAEKIGGECCIICRDEMTIHDSKELPGCGHIFHTSCLRDWLVQQQTCPTCRGDISANEARQQRAANVQQQQEDEEQLEEEANNLRHEALEMAEREQEQQQLAESVNASRSPDVSDVGGDVKNELMSDESAATVDREQTEKVQGHSFEQSQENFPRVFPALYKVVAPKGAIVRQFGSESLTRIIPSGTAILCLEKQLKNSQNNLGLMLKVPGGWVLEDQVEYITAVPLPSQ
mmetsp:Transcript_10266/g.15764  ORF Transcript_10266/g.15764 Transcript_10266/m.15764 type:complete len:595 (-) Transcript_10266:65-1849(-)